MRLYSIVCLYVLYARVCVCPALILSFPVMSLLSEGLGRSTTASTHRVEAGIFVNWEAHCAGPGTNSEYPVQSGDQPSYPLGTIRTIRTETIGQGQIISANLAALYAHAKQLENYTKALNLTLHGGQDGFPSCADTKLNEVERDNLSRNNETVALQQQKHSVRSTPGTPSTAQPSAAPETDADNLSAPPAPSGQDQSTLYSPTETMSPCNETSCNETYTLEDEHPLKEHSTGRSTRTAVPT